MSNPEQGDARSHRQRHPTTNHGPAATRIRAYQSDPRRAQQPGPPPTQPTPHIPSRPTPTARNSHAPLDKRLSISGRRLPVGARNRANPASALRESRAPRAGLDPLLQWASSIGVDARVTSLDARGKPEAGATEQRDPGRPPRSARAPLRHRKRQSFSKRLPTLSMETSPSGQRQQQASIFGVRWPLGSEALLDVGREASRSG